MANKKPIDGAARTAVFGIRVSPGEMRRFEAAARREQRTASQWARIVLLAASMAANGGRNR